MSETNSINTLLHGELSELGLSAADRMLDLKTRHLEGYGLLLAEFVVKYQGQSTAPNFHHPLVDPFLLQLIGILSIPLQKADGSTVFPLILPFPLKGGGAIIDAETSPPCILIDENTIIAASGLTLGLVPHISHLLEDIRRALSEIDLGDMPSAPIGDLDPYWSHVLRVTSTLQYHPHILDLAGHYFDRLAEPFLSTLPLILTLPDTSMSYWAHVTSWQLSLPEQHYTTQTDEHFQFFAAYLCSIIGHEIGHITEGHFAGDLNSERYARYKAVAPRIFPAPFEELDADFAAVHYWRHARDHLGFTKGNLGDGLAFGAASGFTFFLDAMGWWSTKKRPLDDFESWLSCGLLWKQFPAIEGLVSEYPTGVERFSFSNVRTFELFGEALEDLNEVHIGIAAYAIWNVIITSLREDFPLNWAEMDYLDEIDMDTCPLMPSSPTLARITAFERSGEKRRNQVTDAYVQWQRMSPEGNRAFSDSSETAAQMTEAFVQASKRT